MWVTYIIYSPILDRYYIGYTQNIGIRLEQHRRGLTKTTSRSDDWMLIFKQSNPKESEAIRLERMIKSKKSRKSIQRFVQNERNEIRPPHTLHGARQEPRI